MADTDVFGDTSEKMSTEDIVAEESTEPPKEDITDAEDTQPEKIVKEELLKEETEQLSPNSIVKETVDENGDVFEETTEVTRKVVKRTMKITETSSTTKTTTMTTPAKLYGKDLSEYDEVDVDALLAQLSPEEINILAKEVDPDDNFLPPNQRCSYECTKDPTGPLNRKKLIEHINKEALETPDLPEIEPFVKGTVRGKKWVPPPRDEREIAADEQIAIDMGEEYEHALSDATQEEIIDLAAILGFHSMMNQDQYHASLLNKGQPVGLGWDGITKSTTQKLYPMDPPNNTDVEESVKRVKEDDPKLIELNLNNIKNISDEKFEQLFDALPQNEHLEVLSLTNVGLTDKTALLLAEAIEKSKTLRVLNVETNFINPPVIVTLVKALLKARTIEEFRASNQRSTVLGNKIEMEITDLVEKNTSLLRLGLHLEFNDARHRVAAHLQRNIDRNEHELRKGTSSSPIPNATSVNKSGTVDDLSSMLSSQNANRTKSPKPMHIVLTPKDRIDSKSELIAALASQKLSDSSRGEVSLAVPQTQTKAVSRSPPNDRVNTAKDRRSPIKEKEASPKAVEKQIEIDVRPNEVKDSKSTSPTRNPKIGDLRHSRLSKAVDVESTSEQESNDLVRQEVVNNGVNNSVKKQDDQQVENPKIKVSLETSVDDKNRRINVAVPECQTEKEVANAPAVDRSKDSKNEKSPVADHQTGKDLVSPAADLVSDKPTISLDNSVDAKIQSQTEKDQLAMPVRTADDLAADRESVSPGRNLEDRMTLLRAKIDNFAEVADQKLSSIRSKFDDIARDTTLDQPIEAPKKREISKPVPVRVDEPIKVIETLPQSTGPSTLPPIAPQTGDRAPKLRKTIPARPLVRTPNSVGITFLYQRQFVIKPEIEAVSANLDKIVNPTNQWPTEPSEHSPEPPSAGKPTDPSDKSVEIVETLQSELTVEKITDFSKEPKIADRISVEPIEKTIKIVESPQNASDAIKKLADRADEPVKSVSNPMRDVTAPTTLQPSSQLTDLIADRSPLKVSELRDRTSSKVDETAITSVKEKKSQQITKAEREIAALSLLSIKKGEALKIDPLKMVEAATQSPAKPSPLSCLSVKKVDSQKIDPPKTIEVGSQSPVKPNPMSLLSVKRGDLVDIVPTTKSEVSTQFTYKVPIAEVSSQTVEDEPIQTAEEATQTPLVFSSLEHDYVFPGLRRVPHLPRTKTINIGDGDRVIIKPSSKPINEVLMVLYPSFPSYSTAKPQFDQSSTKSFGLEEDLIQTNLTENTIKDLEEALINATEVSDSIVKSSEEGGETATSIKTEIEIPLGGETQPDSIDSSVDDPTVTSDDPTVTSTATRFETQFTAVEKVSALSCTTISSEAHVEVIDKAYKSMAKVSASEGEHVSKTSIRSANMWESLSSNLIKASEQTLLDIAKSTDMGKVGKVSVYSSVEDLSHSSRSKYTDRHIGGLIKTVEKTTVYSSTEDIPITAYTRYSDRYNDNRTKDKKSVYSSTEDLELSSHTKYSDRYASDLLKSTGKKSVYSSIEDLPEVTYTKYSDRYSDTKRKASHFSIETPLPGDKPEEDFLPLPRSKFSDRYKTDHIKSVDTQRSQPKFPVSQTSSKSSRSYYKSSAFDDFSSTRSHYKASEDLSYKTDSSTHKYAKSHDYSLQSAIMSSITHNESALRPYTYVPKSIYSDLAIEHVPSRPTSPAVKHTSTLQLKISPSGIRESTPRRYINKDTIDKPKIVVSRAIDDKRSIRAYSPVARSHASSNLLSPYRKVSDRADDNDSIDESSQSTLTISSASAAEYNASTTKNSTTTDTPKKRANIMDTIKMLKNRVRDVITTEDRFSEAHRLPPSSSSSASVSSRAAQTFTTATSSSLTIPHDNDEKEI